MAGLDPATQTLGRAQAESLDPRVKPGDEGKGKCGRGLRPFGMTMRTVPGATRNLVPRIFPGCGTGALPHRRRSML